MNKEFFWAWLFFGVISLVFFILSGESNQYMDAEGFMKLGIGSFIFSGGIFVVMIYDILDRLEKCE